MIEDDVNVRVARLEQRVTDLDLRMTALMPVTLTVVQLTERVETLRTDFADFRKKIDEDRDDTRKERRVYIRWAITLTITIVAALIGAAAVILTTAHP